MPELEKEQNNKHPSGEEKLLPIAELYPELNPDEQAEYFLNRFLEIMHEIFEEKQHLTSSAETFNLPGPAEKKS